ncbi:MAG: hypothetical protein ABH803_00425 [Candidatus Micrarchaeota archaeon]
MRFVLLFLLFATSFVAAVCDELPSEFQFFDGMSEEDEVTAPNGVRIVLVEFVYPPSNPDSTADVKLDFYSGGSKVNSVTLAEGSDYSFNNVRVFVCDVFEWLDGAVYSRIRFASGSSPLPPATPSSTPTPSVTPTPSGSVTPTPTASVTPSSTPVPSLFASSEEKTASKRLVKGWNLVSFSFDVSSLTGCSLKVFEFNNGYKELALSSVLSAGKGYWLKASQACVLQASGSSNSLLLRLNAGWNLVGSSRDVSWNDFNADCFVESGLWEWTGAWKKTALMKAGKAYFVKVKSNCFVGS